MTQFWMVQSSMLMMFLSSTMKEGRYTEFIGNLTGIFFVATKRDHTFLLSQGSNAHKMSSNSNNLWQICVTETLATTYK